MVSVTRSMEHFKECVKHWVVPGFKTPYKKLAKNKRVRRVRHMYMKTIERLRPELRLSVPEDVVITHDRLGI